MPIVMLILPVFGWFTGLLGGLSFDAQTVALEFIMLGRVPGTGLFIQFEMIIATFIVAAFSGAVYVIFRSPNQQKTH